MTMTNVMETNNKRISQSNKQALRNPWVLGWIALVMIVLTVNVAMITTAFLTNPGLVEEDYYEKGREHEQNFLKKAAAFKALGWHYKLDIPERPLLGETTAYRFNAVDKQGLALQDIEVKLVAYRPSDAAADFTVPMQAFAPGQYETRIAFPLKGMWELSVQVVRGEENYNLAQQRVTVFTH